MDCVPTTSSARAVDRACLLRWFTLAESLGGVESWVAHPASMTHASVTPEGPEDLIADLRQVLRTLPD